MGDYDLEYRVIDPAEGTVTRALGAAERLIRPHSLAQSMAHRVTRSCECPAANLERRAWADPADGRKRHESFADLFDAALEGYPALAESFVRGNLALSLNYDGMPEA